MKFNFLSSSIGKKVIMSLSGAFLIIFIIAHLLGNLEIFAGREAVNSYAAFLRTIPKLLWGLRIATIVAFTLHVTTSIQLSLANRAARAQPYALKKSIAATLASRTMFWGGLVVLSFVLYHLAHFTLNITNPEFELLIDEKGRHDVYAMMITGFQNPLIATMYLAAQVALALHLSHGFASAAQTLGITNCIALRFFKQGGLVFSIIIFALYSSIPLAVLSGFLTLD